MADTTLAHIRGAMRGPDLRRLLAIRLVGQGGDGFFQVALLASVLAPGAGSTLLDLFLDRRRHGAPVHPARPVRRGVHRPLATAVDPPVRTAAEGRAPAARADRPDPEPRRLLPGSARRDLGEPVPVVDGRRRGAAPRGGGRPARRELGRHRRRFAREPPGGLRGRAARRDRGEPSRLGGDRGRVLARDLVGRHADRRPTCRPSRSPKTTCCCGTRSAGSSSNWATC